MDITGTSYTVTHGNTITLPCSTAGSNPSATSLSWKKGSLSASDIVASTKYGGGTINIPNLTIRDANFNDEATYYCVASNGVGTNQDSAFLDVQGSKYTPIWI